MGFYRLDSNGHFFRMDVVCNLYLKKTKESIQGNVYDISNDCWRLGVVVMLQAIWKRRCMYRDPREDTAVARARALLHGRLRNAYMTVRTLTTPATPHRTAAAQLCHLVLIQPSPATQQLPPLMRSSQHYVLYFDGGSRCNRSRSVIVRLGGRKITLDDQCLPRVANDQQHS